MIWFGLVNCVRLFLIIQVGCNLADELWLNLDQILGFTIVSVQAWDWSLVVIYWWELILELLDLGQVVWSRRVVQGTWIQLIFTTQWSESLWFESYGYLLSSICYFPVPHWNVRFCTEDALVGVVKYAIPLFLELVVGFVDWIGSNWPLTQILPKFGLDLI